MAMLPHRVSNTLTDTITPQVLPPLADDDRDGVTNGSPATDKSSLSNAASDGDDEPVEKVFLPNNILATWPWPRSLNQFYPEVAEASTSWIGSFEAFSPDAQEAFSRYRYGYLSCLIFPTENKGKEALQVYQPTMSWKVHTEHARIVCDWMNIEGFVDIETDMASDDHEVRKQMDIMKDTIRNPHKPRPQGEWIGGEIVRQFWERTIPHASAQSQKRFILALDEYVGSMVPEANDRSERRIRNIQDYTDMSRKTIGAMPISALYRLGLDIPDEVIAHQTIQDMETAHTDILSIFNDMVSYNVEQSRGQAGHNIVTIAMHELNMDVNGAMSWAAGLHEENEKKFLKAYSTLPKWGEPIDSQVKEYCDDMASWVRGNYEWSFETEKYLGTKGLEIKGNGWMTLMPKVHVKGPWTPA